MGEKWKNPPVFYAVAQFRFHQVLAMDKYLPEVQDRLRLRGFPDFRTANEFEVELGSQQVTAKEARWSFLNRTQTQAYVLTTSSLAFHTTNYEDFEQFSEQVLLGLEDFHEVVKLELLTRIGLRLLDAVTTTEALPVEKALEPGLFGAFSNLGGNLEHSYLETVQRIENRQLVSKVFVVARGLPLPPDLHPLPLNLPKQLHGIKDQTATLDNDCFTTETIDLSSGLQRQQIAEKLGELKKSLNAAFRCATTDAARKAWM